MKPRKPISRISKKRLEREFGNKLPSSTIKKTYKRVKQITQHQRDRLAALKVIRDRWWSEGRRMCGICHKPILTREEYTLDHIEPGHGKSDHESNLQPAHGHCNLAKGSRRDFSLDK